MTPAPLRCPTCRAPFRAALCGRCGADLAPLIAIATAAHARRERARLALAAGDAAEAQRLVLEARQLHDTGRGRALEAIAAVALGQRDESLRLLRMS